jgi:putative flippase GtrA
MRSNPRAELRRFVTFSAIGVANTLLSLGVYSVVIAAGAGYLAAAPVGFAAGAVNGYLLNSRWTFRRRRSRRSLNRYLWVQLAALALTDIVLSLLVAATGEPSADYVATLILISAATFAASRWWVFGEPF